MLQRFVGLAELLTRPDDVQEVLFLQPEKPEFRKLERKVDTSGTVTILGTHFKIGIERVGETINVLYDDAAIMFFDDHGSEIITHPIPPRGTAYVGNGKPRGFMANSQPSRT